MLPTYQHISRHKPDGMHKQTGATSLSQADDNEPFSS